MGGTNQFAAYQNETPMDAFLPGFCAALYPCSACTAVDFLKLPNALFYEGSMPVNHAHAENRVIIETLQSSYVDLDRLRHEARVLSKSLRKIIGLQFTLRLNFSALRINIWGGKM